MYALNPGSPSKVESVHSQPLPTSSRTPQALASPTWEPTGVGAQLRKSKLPGGMVTASPQGNRRSPPSGWP